MRGALCHYRILSRLGVGGMGEVYLAADTRLNRNVAIKVLQPGAGDNQEARRRMLHEARMVATIDHPNVCTVHEIGTDDESPYIVMQYVEGETLLERMRRGRIDLAEAVNIASQIASALAEAHARGVVHRDIKPGNIMISSAGVVKVLDFGLAKPLDGPATDTRTAMSMAGQVAGTTPYMSPEQIRAEPLDGRSDIFSLGVVLYELVSGARPFDRPTAAATMAAILTEDPPPLASPLQSVIARALARPVSHRFASAAALREALTRVGRGPQEDPPPPRRDLPKAAVDPAAEKLSARARAVEQAPSRRDATGDYDAAIANMERAVALGGRTAIFIGALGHCLAASGRHDDARALLRELEGRSRDRYVSPFNVMLVHLGLGDLHQAFVHFEDALAEHNAQLRMAPVEPRFDPLRGDARFRELTARFGLRSEA